MDPEERTNGYGGKGGKPEEFSIMSANRRQ